MMSLFTSLDYAAAHELVFALGPDGKPSWPGYKPEVVEIPNGDGRADRGKRYAHVKLEHKVWPGNDGQTMDRPAWRVLGPMFNAAFARACAAAVEIGIPSQFFPVPEACALRILEYPPGVGGEQHTDFDLFTINCYRNIDIGLQTLTRPMRSQPSDVHIGEIFDLVFQIPKRSFQPAATVHRVQSCASSQYSIVFFALPAHATVLPCGQTVGDWVAERYARSRTAATNV